MNGEMQRREAILILGAERLLRGFRDQGQRGSLVESVEYGRVDAVPRVLALDVQQRPQPSREGLVDRGQEVHILPDDGNVERSLVAVILGPEQVPMVLDEVLGERSVAHIVGDEVEECLVFRRSPAVQMLSILPGKVIAIGLFAQDQSIVLRVFDDLVEGLLGGMLLRCERRGLWRRTVFVVVIAVIRVDGHRRLRCQDHCTGMVDLIDSSRGAFTRNAVCPSSSAILARNYQTLCQLFSNRPDDHESGLC